MRSSFPGTLATVLAAGLSAGQPIGAAGQQPAQAVVGRIAGHAEAAALTAVCAAHAEDGDAFLTQVEVARAIENEDAAKAALDAVEPDARRMAEEAPSDVAAQYRLAAVMGARLDHEDGGRKMSGAQELRDQALTVLELDPEHAGASYMLGKIHASVLRLGGFKRFLAKQLFGGGALEGASWEEAQRLLEVAVRGDPCVPDHHWELARVYAERGEAVAAERELAAGRALTEGRDGRLARIRLRAEELGRSL